WIALPVPPLNSPFLLLSPQHDCRLLSLLLRTLALRSIHSHRLMDSIRLRPVLPGAKRVEFGLRPASPCAGYGLSAELSQLRSPSPEASVPHFRHCFPTRSAASSTCLALQSHGARVSPTRPLRIHAPRCSVAAAGSSRRIQTGTGWS